MLRTYELQLCVQRNLQRPRYAVNFSSLAVSRALCDLLLLLGWCCIEAAATGVCADSLQWCVPRACSTFFLYRGFKGASLIFCRQISKLRLRGISTRAGSRVKLTATDRQQSTLVGFKQWLWYISTSVLSAPASSSTYSKTEIS